MPSFNLCSSSTNQCIEFVKSFAAGNYTELRIAGLEDRSTEEIIQILSALPSNIRPLSLEDRNLFLRPTEEIKKILGALPPTLFSLEFDGPMSNISPEKAREILKNIPSGIRYLTLKKFYHSLKDAINETITDLTLSPDYFEKAKENAEQFASDFPKIKHLNLYGIANPLTEIPAACRKLPSTITSMDLTRNALLSKKDALKFIPAGVKFLNLQSNFRLTDEKNMAALSSIPPQVKHVDLNSSVKQYDYLSLAGLPPSVSEISLDCSDLPSDLTELQKLGESLPHIVTINVNRSWLFSEEDRKRKDVLQSYVGASIYKNYLELQKNHTPEQALRILANKTSCSTQEILKVIHAHQARAKSTEPLATVKNEDHSFQFKYLYALASASILALSIGILCLGLHATTLGLILTVSGGIGSGFSTHRFFTLQNDEKSTLSTAPNLSLNPA